MDVIPPTGTYREQTAACQVAFGEVSWAESQEMIVECYYRRRAVDRPTTSRLVQRTCCQRTHTSIEINCTQQTSTNCYRPYISDAILSIDLASIKQTGLYMSEKNTDNFSR